MQAANELWFWLWLFALVALSVGNFAMTLVALLLYFDWSDGIIRLCVSLANVVGNIAAAVILANICLYETSCIVHNTTTSELNRREKLIQKLQNKEHVRTSIPADGLCENKQEPDYTMNPLRNYSPYDRGVVQNIAECCTNGVYAAVCLVVNKINKLIDSVF